MTNNQVETHEFKERPFNAEQDSCWNCGQPRSYAVHQTHERVEKMRDDMSEMLAQLRWYGHAIAGGGPIGGYQRAAKHAEDFWYKRTLPFLEKLNAVYGPPGRVGCLNCRSDGYTPTGICQPCGGSGFIAEKESHG